MPLSSCPLFDLCQQHCPVRLIISLSVSSASNPFQSRTLENNLMLECTNVLCDRADIFIVPLCTLCNYKAFRTITPVNYTVALEIVMDTSGSIYNSIFRYGSIWISSVDSWSLEEGLYSIPLWKLWVYWHLSNHKLPLIAAAIKRTNPFHCLCR